MKCFLSLLAILFFGMVSPLSLAAQVIPCGSAMPILDNSCTASSNFVITVNGISGTELGTDVILQEVRFIIAHTWDNDLDIQLISPSGVSIELSTDNGGGADHYGDPSDNTCSNYTSLKMNACTSIENGVAPFIGSYIPEGNFSDFNDHSNPNGNWILKICDDAQNDVGTLRFAELIFAEMSCPPVTMLRVDTLLGNGVAINWLSGSSCVNTLLEYGPAGFQPGTGAAPNEGTLISLNCPVAQPYTLTGLNDLTTYDIYIRESCSNGGYAQNSCPLTITTNCNTPAITLLENFDTLAGCATSCGTTCPITGTWFNSTADDFDWIIDAGGTGSANTGPGDDVSGGGQYIYTEASGSACRNGNIAILESACLLVGASEGNCHLSFYHHLYGTHINELRLDISTNGGISWTNLWNLTGDQGDVWSRTYIDLSAYDNLLANFRFVVIGGNGIRGDMALDEITFYGSHLANNGGNTFYADADNDGFGDPNDFITICTQLLPSGFVDNADDCDDTTASVSPLAAEIPCNDIDENCDGFLLQDLPPLSVDNQVVCVGEVATLMVNGAAVGDFYWFSEDGNLLFVGDTLVTVPLIENTIFYVQDSVVNTCASPRSTALVTVDSGPNIGTNDVPVICLGDSFDLTTLDIIDADNNVVTITYHHESPASNGNELAIPIVNPVVNNTYYLRAQTINGCSTELPVNIMVNNTPTASISALNNDLNICANELSTLTGSENGTGTGQITFEWEDGSTAPQRTIYPSNPPAPFTYELKATDSNGCTDVDTIVINTLPSITGVGIASITNVSFCDGNDGAIILDPVNGIPPFTYQWSGPVEGTATSASGLFTMANLTQGSYKVTVSDDSGEGCSVFIPNIVVSGPGAIVDTIIGIQNVSCFGTNDGAIDINVSGGNPSYSWSNGATTQDLEQVASGVYSVTIIDGICETVLSDLEITSPSLQEITIASVSQVTCAGAADGSIDINVAGGVGNYTYEWSNNATTEDLSALPAGDYQVTITDANNCSITSTDISISAPSPLEISLENLTEISCYNGSDGAITFTAFGGTAPYFFEWSNGILTNSISNLSAGSYQLTVTDANQCSVIGEIITLSEPIGLAVTLDSLQVPDCNELQNGAIAVTVNGGAAPYTYQWSNNATTKDLSNLPEGEYRLMVTDSKGCTALSPIYELTAPEVLFFGLVFINKESCFGVGDGSITTQIVGGTPPYSYQWSHGAQTKDIENLSAGSYQLLITDNNGCTKLSDTLEVAALEPLSASIEELSDISCAGNADGSIYLDVPVEGMPYTYLWDNGATTPYLEGVSAGTYRARITAGDGCIFYTDTITITSPESLVVEATSIESPTCNGFFNGNIDVAVSGGTLPYVFSWNNGNQEEDLTGAPAGIYQLTVIDQNGCATQMEEVVLVEPILLGLDVESTDVGCVDSIGNITVTPTGGTAPYQYLWNTGDTLPSLEGLPASSYSLTLTDANGCILLNSGLAISQLLDSLVVNATIDSEISCFGQSDASLAAEIVGGNYPFQYNWSNGVTDSLNQTISEGNYSVTVTDNYGCVGVSEILEIEQPANLEYFVNSITGNLCLGDENGSVAITVSGGHAPYIINWSNGEDSTFVEGLATGNYYVTITDQNNCTTVSTQPIFITGPASSVQAEIVGDDSVNCFGDMDAALLVVPSGGVGNYSFAWSNGSTTESIEELGAGFYQCTITDLNGCVFVTSNYEINGPDQPLQILMDSSQVFNNEDCSGSDGFVNPFVIGGTSPYNYLWNNNTITPILSNLVSGAYYCTVTDANGCMAQAGPFLIEEPENTLVINMLSTPDTNEMSDGTAAPEVTGGNWPYTFTWDQGTGFQTDSIATNLATGVYNITITDANQCMIVGEVLVDTFSILSDATVDMSQLGTFDFYPNPASDYLQIMLDLKKNSDVTVSCYSMIGAELLELKLGNIRTSRQKIDVTKMTAGLYILVVKIDGLLAVRELIVIE